MRQCNARSRLEGLGNDNYCLLILFCCPRFNCSVPLLTHLQLRRCYCISPSFPRCLPFPVFLPIVIQSSETRRSAQSIVNDGHVRIPYTPSRSDRLPTQSNKSRVYWDAVSPVCVLFEIGDMIRPR